MSSMQQTGNRFPSYSTANQRSSNAKKVVPQILSGSETDVSTSNENLTNEEQYVIRLPTRQEPQGQENLQSSNRSSLRDSLPSNRSSLDVSSSSYNTLIIHSVGNESWMNRNSLEVNNNGTGVQEITEIPDDFLNQSHVLKHLAKEVKMPSGSIASPSIRETQILENEATVQRLPMRKENYRGKEKQPGQSLINRQRQKFEKITQSKSQPDLSKITDEEEEELTPNKRGMSAPRPRTKGREETTAEKGKVWPSAEVVAIIIQENSSLKLEIENLYQKVARAQRVSFETQRLEHEITNVHRAHEDLVASSERRESLERTARARLLSECRRLQEMNKSYREQNEMLQNQLLTMRTPTPDMSGATATTEALRRELNKREVLIAQLITQNKDLVAAKERQEIELAAQRATLQEQRTHIDILDTALTNAQGNVVRLEEECRKKQMYVERVAQLQRALSSLQLASDRREQTERKLRFQLEQELRMERSRSANGDGNHSSLSNGHGGSDFNLADLKRFLREKDEKIMHLEGECAKWEQRYLEENALRQAAIDAASIPKDAKIAALEKNSQDAEKMIAEARTEKMRQMDEVHAAQKKVADLEARLKDFESKLAERDAMIRVLQKRRAYDKDVSNSSSYSNILSRSPHHTPHSSLHGGTDLDAVLSANSSSREELVNSVLTGSTGFGSSNSYSGSDASSYHHMQSYHPSGASKYGTNKNFDTTKKSLDDQLKELDSQLDSQLLSKRGLCCFPGFSNAGLSSRKGKLQKQLLAGVVGTNKPARQFETTTGFLQGLIQGGCGSGSRHENNTRPEEMLLLEKQGRTSQQQRINIPDSSDQARAEQRASTGSSKSDRAGSLPPSSLPRPPRSSLPRARRIGEYGRLIANEENAPPNGRKKSDGGDSISSNGSINSKRPSPNRSFIPAPRKLGEYGRLNESNSSLRKPNIRSSTDSAQSNISCGGGNRDSTSTMSDNSATSQMSSPSKLRMYEVTSSSSRRSSSLGRQTKSTDGSNSSISKYRIRF